MRTVEEIQKDISALEAGIYCAQMSDNRYALSGRMNADQTKLKSLKAELEKAQQATQQ